MEELFNQPDIMTETAQQKFGINYLFPFQRLVISNILESCEFIQKSGGFEAEFYEDPPLKQIIILPTGAGKSLCFMLPSVLLPGPTLVIFPLLSLISDQLRRCEEAGIRAAKLVGGQNESERRKIFSGIADGSIRIILSNPETSLSDQVLPELKKSGFIHLVFDEVHTVSEWGDTFRPAYLESRRIFTEADIPIVSAFTATASEAVLNRVKQVLFPEESPHVVSADPDRPNISYTVLPSLCKINSLELLLKPEDEADSREYPPAELVQRPALIFCRTRRKAQMTALQLRLRLKDPEIYFYHAGLDKQEKAEIEAWFFSSKSGVLCATTAYGMGIDKPDIRTVIHQDLSPSVEAYLQESGRAGRDRNCAEALLLISPEDLNFEKDSRMSPQAAERYSALLEFAVNNKICRRESLMRLLDAEPDTCFGCDVCRKSVETNSPHEDKALKLLKRNKRVLTLPGSRKMLAGSFGIDEEDAEQIIEQLIVKGSIKKIRRGPWKGKLTIMKKGHPKKWMTF